MNLLPVYLFTGFLEGGKTHIIQESMEDKKFNSGEKTLLIQCEEGEEELDLDRFYGKNVYLENVTEEQCNKAYLTELSKKHRLDRVIIEYNGMWPMQKLYEAIPDAWGIYQEMMFADANTFLTYNSNMRQQTVDKLLNAEMIVLNRTPAVIDKESIHKVIRGISRRCAITYDYPDGHVEYDEIEDPLPFEVNAPVVTIADRDYALFYRDLSEDMGKYQDKTVTFKGIAVRDAKLGDKSFLVGRHVMTCCEADIAYNPVICICKGVSDVETKDWIIVQGTFKIEKHPMYRGQGPVLYIDTVTPADKPEQEVATFY